MPETCRNWIEDTNDRCGRPAIVIVWGKLFDKEFLGPRCEDCLHDQIGSHWTDPSYAIYRLPAPTQPVSKNPEELGKRLLDDDGPVLLEVREAISDLVPTAEWLDAEGDPLHANGADVEALGDAVCGRVEKALRAALKETASPSVDDSEVGEGRR